MKAFAGLQAAAVEHVAPDREEGFRQRGRLDVAQALGHRQALADRRDAQFGIAATGHQRADAVADLEAGSRHRLGVAARDGARHFQAGNVGRARRHRVVAGALQHVGRFTPLAATRISTSPAPGTGSGVQRGAGLPARRTG
jgi:hypothetical protein